MDINEEFLKLTEDGCCPCLIYDDDGHFAVSVTGVQGIGKTGDDDDWWCNVVVENPLWRDTPNDAMQAFLEQLKQGS